ncbi:hypothetical protein ABTE44_19325, partial [Acinetobacter baumannii]
MEAILAHDRSAAVRLAGTIASDPDFALAHAVNGLLVLSLARADVIPAALVCMDDALRAKAARTISDREDKFL